MVERDLTPENNIVVNPSKSQMHEDVVLREVCKQQTSENNLFGRIFVNIFIIYD